MEYTQINGVRVSRIGLGTWAIGGGEWGRGKRVLHLTLRWLLDQPGVTIALWGARRPAQLASTNEVFGWKLTGQDMQAIDQIVRETVKDPVGPEYLRPELRQ